MKLNLAIALRISAKRDTSGTYMPSWLAQRSNMYKGNIMQKIAGMLFMYALISLWVMGWLDIFGPQYTWWNLIKIMGG
jgi:hypothetical protein